MVKKKDDKKLTKDQAEKKILSLKKDLLRRVLQDYTHQLKTQNDKENIERCSY